MNRVVLIGLITLALILSGCVGQQEVSPSVQACIDEWGEQNLEPGRDFAAGQVLVVFNENVSEDESKNLIASQGLTFISSTPKMLNYWVKVLDGHPTDYIDSIESSDIVLWAKYRGNSQGNPETEYLLVQFNLKATQQTAQDLINSFDNLEIDFETSVTSKSRGLVLVFPGSEYEWICKLKENERIESVELNGFMK